MKIGDRVKVIRCIHGHEFKIGEEVTLIDRTEDDAFEAENDNGETWYLQEEEIELIED